MGLRLLIPEKYRVRLLDDLHQEHHEICQMKSLARGYFWWPGLDAAIVEMDKSPPRALLYPWKWPAKPCSVSTLIYLRRGS